MITRPGCRAGAIIPLLAALCLAGCTQRPDTAAAAPTPEDTAVLLPSPTQAVSYTVEFRQGELLLDTETVIEGQFPGWLPEAQNAFLLGWTTAAGEDVDPAQVPVTGDTVYYAQTRPMVHTEADWLFPDERGFLQPEASFTTHQAAQALRALVDPENLPGDTVTAWETGEDAPLTAREFETFLGTMFTQEELDSIRDNLPETTDVPTRADAAWCVAALTNAEPKEGRYFPDVSPAHWAGVALLAAAGPGTLDKDTLISETWEGFLWFDGYLYRLDDQGYFVTDRELDGLTYDPTGRYTSGDTELDGYVAESLRTYLPQGTTRREVLRAVYLHVRNDFQYLARNYYGFGETGWVIPEALTMFETGKGNCYDYAALFCSLARGLGYNATAYSGTMGVQNQQHAWTEITLEGQVYVCDPEIELNYWFLGNYTDNFMVPRGDAVNW